MSDTKELTQPQNGQSTGIKGVSEFLNTEKIKQKFTEILGSKGQGFIASILSACNMSDDLKKATTESIYTAALTAASLDLAINPNLGFAYLIPYVTNRGKSNEVVLCQFQMGYKGYIQLAQRSGLYNKISATQVYEGQLIKEDPLLGNQFDWTQKKSDKVIGYVSYFRLLNGFESMFYMTTEQCSAHANRYSQSFRSQTKWVRENSKWFTDFDVMAKKTVLKLNLSKNGPLSIEMQKALVTDQSVVNMEQEPIYIDNQTPKPDKELERATLLLSEANSHEELKAYWDSFGDDIRAQLNDEMETKYQELEK